MTRFNINCDDVWREVSGVKFVNMTSVNEYDFDSVRRLAELIQEALEVLHSPATLSPEQRNDLVTKIRKLETRLAKESVLEKRVDPRVPVYST